jgi:hypothetical protein
MIQATGVIAKKVAKKLSPKLNAIDKKAFYF